MRWKYTTLSRLSVYSKRKDRIMKRRKSVPTFSLFRVFYLLKYIHRTRCLQLIKLYKHSCNNNFTRFSTRLTKTNTVFVHNQSRTLNRYNKRYKQKHSCNVLRIYISQRSWSKTLRELESIRHYSTIHNQ